MAVVYLATNRLNGKRYIGVTSKTLAFRRRQHEQAPNAKRVTCRYFHAAMRKYGPASFEWMVLAECETFEAALQEEIRLIAEIRPEYNLTRGGQGTAGRVVTQEQRERFSRLMKGRKISSEAIAKIVAKNIGRTRTPEQRERMGAARRGKPFSNEHRINLSLAHVGKKQPAETIEKRRQGRLGKSLSAEHKKKISATLTGRQRPAWVVAKVQEGLRRRFPEHAEKPWIAMGVSRSTWFRHRRNERAIQI